MTMVNFVECRKGSACLFFNHLKRLGLSLYINTPIAPEEQNIIKKMNQ